MKNKILKLLVPVFMVISLTTKAQTDTSNLKLDTTKVLMVGTFKPPYVTINKVHTFVKYQVVVASKDGQKTYPVYCFNMTFIKNGGNIHGFALNQGGAFSLEQKHYLQYANLNDMIRFDNIIFIGDHKKLVRAKPFSFQVISEE